MPSLQARAFNAYSRWVIRREDWGSPELAAGRARRLWGVPGPFRNFGLGPVRTESVPSGVVGEWLVPPSVRPGIILYYHGGGYVACSAATHRPLTGALARASGHRVFAADYRLAPEHRFPAAFDDALAAYQHIAAIGEPVVLAGESAGGGLVLAVAAAARDRGLPSPVGLVCYSPWTDLAATGRSLTTNAGRCHMFHPANVARFAAAYLGSHPATDPRASPVYASLKGLPPALIHVGSTELILDDAVRVHEGLLAAGGTSTLAVFDDIAHGWQLLVGLVPEARRSVAEAARFARSRLAP